MTSYWGLQVKWFLNEVYKPNDFLMRFTSQIIEVYKSNYWGLQVKLLRFTSQIIEVYKSNYWSLQVKLFTLAMAVSDPR